MSWRTLVLATQRRLDSAAFIEDPATDARRLVEEVSGLEGAELQLALDQGATTLAVARIDGLVERRLRGEPLQYVLGRWGFRTLDLFVDRRVLIPRPETEMLVDVVLAECARAPGGPERSHRVVDLGTGSGAIALSVVVERRDVEVWASDRSADALAVARANLAGAGRPAQRVRLVEGSWFDALPESLRGTVDVVASNPPYVAESDPLPDEVREWEPLGALVSGPTGLEAVDLILEVAPRWLAPGGAVVLELAPERAGAAQASARDVGYASVDVVDDLSGRRRVLIARP